MAGYFIAEEGPLSGLIIRFEEGNEWTMGRDPDVSGIVLEDPMVSRKHVVCQLTPEGYLLDNLSAVNPATQNGKIIAEPVLLREGDIIQIGNTFFRFTEKDPQIGLVKEGEENLDSSHGSLDDSLSTSHFESGDGKWLLKVISGPNAGAEFGMQKSSTYIVGKDPNVCEIAFQDLSVSRQHAKITVDADENVFIEDLGSRNGVLVNGEPITDKHLISSQDLIALGTTTFLIIDRLQAPETIYSLPTTQPSRAEAPQQEPVLSGAAATSAPGATAIKMEDWREMIIPRRHLVGAGIFAIMVLAILFAMFSLFKAQPIELPTKDESQLIKEKIKEYSDIQFSYNTSSGKLFLVGHVLTGVDKQELLYIIHSVPFIQSIEDNVVVDEYVWQSMNALIAIHPEWQSISIHSPTPGKFVMKGYLKTLDQSQALADYVTMNFPYLDRLENQVVVESNLLTQIQSMLTSKGLANVALQLSDGEVVLSGRVDEKSSHAYNEIIKELKALAGVRVVKNFVIVTTVDTSRVDLSQQYQVSGYSKKDEKEFFVVINGRILSRGDTLDGMTITGVQPSVVFLEKDGLKFKINYNLQ
jgi:type III secretion system YscD/HrpQ family protein